jgi:hypothetical protein
LRVIIIHKYSSGVSYDVVKWLLVIRRNIWINYLDEVTVLTGVMTSFTSHILDRSLAPASRISTIDSRTHER